MAGSDFFVVAAVCGVEITPLGFETDWFFEGVVAETDGCWGYVGLGGELIYCGVELAVRVEYGG